MVRLASHKDRQNTRIHECNVTAVIILSLIVILGFFHDILLGPSAYLSSWTNPVRVGPFNTPLGAQYDSWLKQDDYRLIPDLSLTKENAEDILFERKYNVRATGCAAADIGISTDWKDLHAYKIIDGEIVCAMSDWPFQFQSDYLPELAEDPSIKQRVKDRMNELSPRDRPLNIVILVLESTPRIQFMHFFNETRKLMMEYSKNEELSHQLFTFNRMLPQGPQTAWNMIPQMLGELWNAGRDGHRVGGTQFNLKGQPLWETLKQFGYLTSISLHDPNLWVARGPKHPFDAHPPDILYDTAPNKSDNTFLQFCDHSHSKTHLMFVQRFLNQSFYAGTPKFIYTHLNNQPDYKFHSLQPLLDVPLADTLRTLMQDENTLVVLQGDHGHKPYGFPLYSMFVPRQFLQKHPNIQHNLWNNQIRPVSALDVHATYLSLGRYPDKLNFSDPDVCYHCGSVGAVPLIEDHMFNRTCASTGILNIHCFCIDEVLAKWDDVKDCQCSGKADKCTQLSDVQCENSECSWGCGHQNKSLIEGTALVQGICDHFNLEVEAQNLLPGQAISNRQMTTCETLTVKSILSLKTAELRTQGESWTNVTFSVESAIDVHYEVLVRNGEVFHAKALTRYAWFANCTDKRFNRQWCICKDI